MRCFFFSPFQRLFVLVPALAACVVVPALFADDSPADKTGEKPPAIAPPTAEELADKRMQFMKKALARYTIQVGEEKEPATAGDPCLRWTNPIGGASDGIIVVYAHTILAESDVTILRSGRLFWKPSEYVCKFADLPRSPHPADKEILRLAQMRGIAADFSVIDNFKGTKQDLRLLHKPVYRYSEKGKILDGALFIFVLGTDPECCSCRLPLSVQLTLTTDN